MYIQTKTVDVSFDSQELRDIAFLMRNGLMRSIEEHFCNISTFKSFDIALAAFKDQKGILLRHMNNFFAVCDGTADPWQEKDLLDHFEKFYKKKNGSLNPKID